MTILNRMGRLFKADVNGILDHIEEPEMMLKQAVRDMEAEIAGEEAELRQTQAEIKELNRKVVDLNKCMEEAEAKIADSLRHQKADIAKAFVKRKLEFERLRNISRQRQEKSESWESELSKRLSERKDQLAVVKQKMEVFLVEKRTEADLASNSITAAEGRLDVTTEDIEVAFLEYQEKFQATTAKGKSKGGA